MVDIKIFNTDWYDVCRDDAAEIADFKMKKDGSFWVALVGARNPIVSFSPDKGLRRFKDPTFTGLHSPACIALLADRLLVGESYSSDRVQPSSIGISQYTLDGELAGGDFEPAVHYPEQMLGCGNELFVLGTNPSHKTRVLYVVSPNKPVHIEETPHLRRIAKDKQGLIHGLFTARPDNTLCRRIASGEWQTYYRNPQSSITDFCFLPDGAIVARGWRDDNNLHFYDLSAEIARYIGAVGLDVKGAKMLVDAKGFLYIARVDQGNLRIGKFRISKETAPPIPS